MPCVPAIPHIYEMCNLEPYRTYRILITFRVYIYDALSLFPSKVLATDNQKALLKWLFTFLLAKQVSFFYMKPIQSTCALK